VVVSKPLFLTPLRNELLQLRFAQIDKFVWRGDNTGEYLVKSGYKWLMAKGKGGDGEEIVATDQYIDLKAFCTKLWKLNVARAEESIKHLFRECPVMSKFCEIWRCCFPHPTMKTIGSDGTYPYENVADSTEAEVTACRSAVVLAKELVFQKVLVIPRQGNRTTYIIAEKGMRFNELWVWVEEAP
ncbi:hypothetical protein Gorai_006201, partial [Gossypium raimondii]|nr:hypothetical protein [Gossypium raimondii]